MMEKIADAETARTHDADAAPPGVEPPSGGSGGGGLTRVTVNLNRQALHALEALSERTGYSKTDAINRALQIYMIVRFVNEIWVA